MRNIRTQGPIIQLEQVDIQLGGRIILQDIDLSIQPGEFVVILGPNGAGKTTFLKLLLGLIQPASGSARVLGQPPKVGSRLIGYAPQHRAFDVELPLRGRDLVGFGLDGHRWGIGLPSRSRREKIDQALKEVDGLHLADAPFGQLSGGEQQRLLIAQALLTDPRLLILDEPLANLDLAYQQDVVSLIDQVCRTRGVTILLVAHDINPLLQVADRVIYMAHGHSAIGSPDEVITESNLTQLYGSPVQVVHTLGRYFVVGAEV
ncbi:MAG TPA: ABC transporter ATP-binding protein [Anaerolineales bacterium]|nr:ABC transporter ATP-binding protein [Anaerolineales bacterium]